MKIITPPTHRRSPGRRRSIGRTIARRFPSARKRPEVGFLLASASGRKRGASRRGEELRLVAMVFLGYTALRRTAAMSVTAATFTTAVMPTTAAVLR